MEFPVINVAANNALWELIASATDFLIITELEIRAVNENFSNGALSIGVGRPASAGMGARGALAPNGENPNAPSSSFLIANSWQVPPVAPSNWLRRAVLLGNVSNNNASGGNAVRFKFIRGLKISPSNSIGIWLITGSSGQSAVNLDIFVRCDG
jgi:hypothetical protein